MSAGKKSRANSTVRRNRSARRPLQHKSANRKAAKTAASSAQPRRRARASKAKAAFDSDSFINGADASYAETLSDPENLSRSSDLWIAPRTSLSRPNDDSSWRMRPAAPSDARLLELADIALGTRKAEPLRRRSKFAASHPAKPHLTSEKDTAEEQA